MQNEVNKGLGLKVSEAEEILIPRIDTLKESLVEAEEKIRALDRDLEEFETCKAENQSLKAELLAVEIEKENILSEMREYNDQVQQVFCLRNLFKV